MNAFDEHYEKTHGTTIGYPPEPLKNSPSTCVARACSSIAIALSASRDASRDTATPTPAWMDDDLPF